MGVTGLWQILSPAGRPVSLESLDGQVLGVDISIWLNQAISAMRDSSGHAISNAHLLNLYQRLCKLMYFHIRPVCSGGRDTLSFRLLYTSCLLGFIARRST